MITVPLLNESTQESTTYDRFSRIVFNNRLGANPSVMITKDRVALLGDKSLLVDTRPYVLSVDESSSQETIEFMGQEYTYEWVYGFMNALSMQVIDKLEQSINVPVDGEEEEVPLE